MGRLQELVTEIEEGKTDGWSISLDSVLSILEEEASSFYRFYYGSGRSASDMPEQFTEENVDLLLDFLEDRGQKDARRVFRRKGWYITPDDLLEWEEFFLSVSLSVLASHVIDEGELEIALAGCLDASDGLRFYCETHFPMADLIERSLRLYRPGALLLPRLKRHTLEQFRRRLLRESTIYGTLLSRLRETAILRGWLRESIRVPSHLQEDLAIFGMREMCDETRLKERYRDLLKKVHPDVNRSPEAVAQTQRINEAYARICGHAGARS